MDFWIECWGRLSVEDDLDKQLAVFEAKNRHKIFSMKGLSGGRVPFWCKILKFERYKMLHIIQKFMIMKKYLVLKRMFDYTVNINRRYLEVCL